MIDSANHVNRELPGTSPARIHEHDTLHRRPHIPPLLDNWTLGLFSRRRVPRPRDHPSPYRLV